MVQWFARLLAGMVAPDTVARGHVWAVKRLAISDGSGPEYDGLVEQALHQLRPILPRGGPRVDYERRSPRTCGSDNTPAC